MNFQFMWIFFLSQALLTDNNTTDDLGETVDPYNLRDLTEPVDSEIKESFF